MHLLFAWTIVSRIRMRCMQSFTPVRKKSLWVSRLGSHIVAVCIVICDFRPSLMLPVALADMTLNEQRDYDLH
jgi:hypothetical protein